jgi:lysophospholipase L1-like esterase
VILAYGGNDQSRGVPASGDGNSFENALKRSVIAIKEMNPQAHIILIAPLNGWLPVDGKYVAFADIDNGGGKLSDYVDATERVAKEENLLCVNMNDVIAFTDDEPKKYFEDGSHLTELGRKIYAQYLTEKMYEYYYSK